MGGDVALGEGYGVGVWGRVSVGVFRVWSAWRWSVGRMPGAHRWQALHHLRAICEGGPFKSDSKGPETQRLLKRHGSFEGKPRGVPLIGKQQEVVKWLLHSRSRLFWGAERAEAPKPPKPRNSRSSVASRDSNSECQPRLIRPHDPIFNLKSDRLLSGHRIVRALGRLRIFLPWSRV